MVEEEIVNSCSASGSVDQFLLGGKYMLMNELGSGAQGQVFMFKDINTGDKCAAKMVRFPPELPWSDTSQFKKEERFSLEQEILQKLKGKPGFPALMDSVLFEGHNFLLME